MSNASHSYHLVYVFMTQLHYTVAVRLLLLQYKNKRSSSDPPSVKIEGELTNDWFAIDLGVCIYHFLLSDIIFFC